MNNDFVILSGSSNFPLATAIASELGLSLGDVIVGKYSDGETFVQVQQNVRNADVYIIQSTSRPANESLMELILMVDACRRASAMRINAVIPYFGYGRQDRKVTPRVPISAKVVATLLESVRVDRVVSVDLHAGQIQGFFEVPVDHLFAQIQLSEEIKSMNIENLVVVSPDTGGVDRARNWAQTLSASWAVVDWQTDVDTGEDRYEVIGKVDGRNVLIVDDMIDTAGTICEAAQIVKDEGAASVRAVCTHAVLSDPAIERIHASPIEELITTDTIDLADKNFGGEIRIVSIAPLLAKAIRNIHEGGSISRLFYEV